MVILLSATLKLLTAINSQVDGNTQVESLVASLPPLVDIINIYIDDWLASFLNKMTAEELQNFCLQVVEVCDTITTRDNKLVFSF